MGKSSASGRIMHPLEFAKAELCFKCVANQITANNAQTENKGVGVQAFTYFLAPGKFEQDRREEASRLSQCRSLILLDLARSLFWPVLHLERIGERLLRQQENNGDISHFQ
jgi:hypothetical protein